MVEGGVPVLVHSTGHSLDGLQVSQGESSTTEPDEGPSPITPEGKELLWGLGAFLVLLVAMRLYLVPKLKEGMQRRYGKVVSDLEHAEEMRDAARLEVAKYETQLAAVRAEAAGRIDAARQVLDRERTDRINEANAAIAARRSAAASEAEAARIAVSASMEDAVESVAARLIELSTGRRPDEATVRRAVAELTTTGARA